MKLSPRSIGGPHFQAGSQPHLEKKGLLPLSSSKLTPTAYLPGYPGAQGPESTSLALPLELQHWVHVGPYESYPGGQVPPLQ